MARDLLSDRHEGTLGPALQISLESHLRECEACRVDADVLSDVWRLLDSAPTVDPPADLRASVWRRIDAAELQRKNTVRPARLRWSWRTLLTRPALGWAAAGAAVVVLAGIVVPGQFTAARMGWPGGISPTSPDAGIRAHVGEMRVMVSEGQPWLVVGLTTESPTPVSVTVRPSAASRSFLAGDPAAVVLRPGESVDIALRLTTETQGLPSLALDIARADEPTRRQTLPLPPVREGTDRSP